MGAPGGGLARCEMNPIHGCDPLTPGDGVDVRVSRTSLSPSFLPLGFGRPDSLRSIRQSER